MSEAKLKWVQTLLPVAPFLLVILAANLVFLEWSTRVENRETSVTFTSADGSTVTNSKWKDVTMVDFRWKIGPFSFHTSTRPEGNLLVETDRRTLGEAVGVSVSRMRSKVAIAVFPVALIAWFLIGRRLQWHSRVAVSGSRFFPPIRTVGLFLSILGVFVVGFALMKPWWPAGVSGLVGWLRSNITGVAPFVSIVIVFPVAEEMIFRSGLCRFFVERIGPAAGIFLQALLFGSLHLATPLHSVVGFIGGIVLGTVYVYTRSLKAAIILHAGANCLLVVACLIIR